MAAVSYTVIASGTVDGPSGSRTDIWNNIPHADRVHMFWISIQPTGGAGQVQNDHSEAWITKAVHKVSDNPFNRQAIVSWSYTTSKKADFSVLMASVAP